MFPSHQGKPMFTNDVNQYEKALLSDRNKKRGSN